METKTGASRDVYNKTDVKSTFSLEQIIDFKKEKMLRVVKLTVSF